MIYRVLGSTSGPLPIFVSFVSDKLRLRLDMALSWYPSKIATLEVISRNEISLEMFCCRAIMKKLNVS